MKTLALNWNPVPASLPPGAEDHWWSPHVWLALSNGRVTKGCCLHRTKNATHDAPVHSWFAEDENGERCQINTDDVQVIAWMPFAVPDHPGLQLDAQETKMIEGQQ